MRVSDIWIAQRGDVGARYLYLNAPNMIGQIRSCGRHPSTKQLTQYQDPLFTR